ncbi:hypothetical protein M408DRAFT_208390 [Serendipita vermifera MAFF 305830]|uniref:Uncharacterized protein n=1 Tax=Serendipita vermifera MAFF 305830 TaxID=933852 RepID=A0A0C2X8L0_SERVB|nr:hypothetical protein M408DRAFT_208390 [Serendipita vermifera MAFF 305830]
MGLFARQVEHAVPQAVQERATDAVPAEHEHAHSGVLAATHTVSMVRPVAMVKAVLVQEERVAGQVHALQESSVAVEFHALHRVVVVAAHLGEVVQLEQNVVEDLVALHRMPFVAPTDTAKKGKSAVSVTAETSVQAIATSIRKKRTSNRNQTCPRLFSPTWR